MDKMRGGGYANLEKTRGVSGGGVRKKKRGYVIGGVGVRLEE